jgi:hypothetical protein
MAEAACFSCIQPNQRALAVVALLCQISEAGGGGDGGSGNSILSGPDSPVGSIEAAGPALYVQDDGTLWTLPEGGDSGDWVQAGSSMPVPVMMAPPPPDEGPVNRIAALESSLASLVEARQIESSAWQEALLALDQKVDQKADGSALDAAEEAAVALLVAEQTRTKTLEAEVSELKRQLQEAASKADLETIRIQTAQVAAPAPAPVAVIVPKKPWWKRALHWTNLFA